MNYIRIYAFLLEKEKKESLKSLYFHYFATIVIITKILSWQLSN